MEEAKPKGKKNDVSSLIRRSADAATELARTLESAAQSNRVREHREKRKQEQVMAILQQHIDIRGQVKRIWPLMSEQDRETLRNFGFQEPRK
jgi:hypothetical protein